MNIIIFISGVFLGALVTFLLMTIIRKTETHIQNKAEEQLKLQFENLANKIFQENSNQFSAQTGEKLEEYFKRFKDKIEIFEKRNEENFKLETEKLIRFDENIKTILNAGNQISKDTSNLLNLMKSDNRTQGYWGEIVLAKVLEASGLRENYEYKLQAENENGRPDATVYLTSERCVYIDAKTSISSWAKFINAENDEEKFYYQKEFITSTKNHINGLAKREYSNNEKSPDYVLMFIPIESCYSLMFCQDCELWDYAWAHKIMPVSPSTLLAALKTISVFHIVDRQNKNAMEISQLCSKMIDKFSSLLSDVLKVHNTLHSALTKLQGKGNILNQLEKIQELGIIINKEIPEIPDDITSQED